MTTTTAKLGRVRVELDRLAACRLESSFTLAEEQQYDSLIDIENDLLESFDGCPRHRR